MEEERLGRTSEQERELRMFQMILSFTKSHQQLYPVNVAPFFPPVQSGNPVLSEMLGANQPQASQPSAEGGSIDGSTDVRYDILGSMTFQSQDLSFLYFRSTGSQCCLSIILPLYLYCLSISVPPIYLSVFVVQFTLSRSQAVFSLIHQYDQCEDSLYDLYYFFNALKVFSQKIRTIQFNNRFDVHHLSNTFLIISPFALFEPHGGVVTLPIVMISSIFDWYHTCNMCAINSTRTLRKVLRYCARHIQCRI